MAKSTEIALGSTVLVKVTKQPTNVAAVKTIQRIFAKDPVVRADHQRLHKIRQAGYAPKPRGGRLYGGQVVKQHPVKARPGESAKLTASQEVIRALASVARFVEVTPA